MKTKVQKLVTIFCMGAFLSSCSSFSAVFMTANYAKDHYCELSPEVRAKVIDQIQKKFPGYKSVCNIPDIIPSK
jgi:hypothetical protein